MIHLIYSLAIDPVVQAARSAEFRSEINFISIRELHSHFMEHNTVHSLDKAMILDRCGDGWDISSQEGLLDRDVAYKDLNALFTSYFCQMHRSKKILSTMFHLGTPWNPNRLPAQWALIQNHCLSLQTPEYFEGDRTEIPEGSDLVFSHPNNLYNWKVAELTDDAQQVFCFRRPPGEALVIARAYDQYAFFKSNGEVVSDLQQEALHRISQQLETIIPFDFGEILLFSHAGEYTFGMFSNYALLSGQFPLFQNLLRKKLQDLVERTIL
jgi:hypothetical protein